MVVGPSKDLRKTSARHTHDQYQAKWDKWDNDDFVDKLCADIDDDSKGKGKGKKQAGGPGDGVSTPVKVLGVGLWLAFCFWAVYKYDQWTTSKAKV